MSDNIFLEWYRSLPYTGKQVLSGELVRLQVLVFELYWAAFNRGDMKEHIRYGKIIHSINDVLKTEYFKGKLA